MLIAQQVVDLRRKYQLIWCALRHRLATTELYNEHIKERAGSCQVKFEKYTKH